MIVLARGLKNTDCVQIVTRPLAARQRPALVTIQRPQLLCHVGPNKRSLIARTRRDELLASGAHLNDINLRICYPTGRCQNR